MATTAKITSMEFNPRADVIATGRDDGTVLFYRIVDQGIELERVLRCTNDSSRSVQAITYCPITARIAVGFDDGSFLIYAPGHTSPIVQCGPIEGRMKAINVFRIFLHGSVFAYELSGWDDILRYATVLGSVVSSDITARISSSKAGAFIDPKGKLINVLQFSEQGTDFTFFKVKSVEPDSEPRIIGYAQSRYVNNIVTSKSGKIIIGTHGLGLKNLVSVWDDDFNVVYESYQGEQSIVEQVAVSDLGPTFACCLVGGHLRILRANDRQLSVIDGVNLNEEVVDLQFSASGEFLGVVSRNGGVFLFRILENEMCLHASVR